MLKEDKHKTSDVLTSAKVKGRKFFVNPGSGMVFDEKLEESGKVRIGRTKLFTTLFL